MEEQEMSSRTELVISPSGTCLVMGALVGRLGDMATSDIVYVSPFWSPVIIRLVELPPTVSSPVSSPPLYSTL